MTSPFTSKHSVSISPWSIILTIGFLLGLYFLYYIHSIVILLFLAFIIMVALNPAVSTLQRKLRLPRALSAFLVYLITISGLVSLLVLIIPPLTQELYQLLRNLDLPPYLQLQQELANFKFTVAEVSALADRVGTSVNLIFSIITSTFSGIFTFFTLIVMSFYLMLDRPFLYKKVGWFSRESRHLEMARSFIDSLESQLGSWVRGQIVLMFIIGLVTFIGLSLLGIPYALPLAILAGLLEILPNLGPTIAAVPAIILAYLGLGPVMAGVTAIFYVLVQQLENNIIVPKIMRDNADVNPLVAIVTILVGLKVGGVVGALLAVPAYILVRSIYSLWYQSQSKS
jgi:predicted PurR-regulated permease PerM